MPDLPERPAPPEPLSQRVLAWLRWVGVGRVVASSAAVLAVLAAAYWLVKPPPATTESSLPYATSSSPTSSGPGTPATASSAATTIVAVDVVVHVAGAVVTSGVYRLPTGSRVVDAVEIAGGLSADAQPDAVNLAAPLTDGQRVYIPRLGEVVPAIDPEPPPGISTAPGPVNLNSATADELDELPGVGPATAAAIIAHREQHGPFGSVDDLADVRGIGPAKVEALRGLVTT
jgi:competence protein ComEA